MSEKSIENEIKFFVKSERGWVTKIHADGVQGKDTVDLIGSLYGLPFIVEVKDGDKAPSKIQQFILDRAAQSGYVAGCVGTLAAFKALFPMATKSILTVRTEKWTPEATDPVELYEDMAVKMHHAYARERLNKARGEEPSSLLTRLSEARLLVNPIPEDAENIEELRQERELILDQLVAEAQKNGEYDNPLEPVTPILEELSTDDYINSL